ncbi:glycosyltransferase family 4 protein [archaeon]|nr:glycosyltransferase family 4 protein [archaeon]
MRVYVQKPWRVSDCASYKLLKENPPEEVTYLNMGASNLIQNKKSLSVNNFIKKTVKKTLLKIYPNMPNAHKAPLGNYDLIHCEHCLLKNNFPWIVNIEYLGQFWATGAVPKKLHREKILRILESSNCKKIITWTEWARQEIIKLFPEIEEKVETVYPGIPFTKIKKQTRKAGKIRLLFVSRSFYFKGGLYAVEVMDRLTKKYPNVEALVVSDVPKEILNKYSVNNKIKFLGMIPQKKLLDEIYPSSDIFVYPSFTDTFGFAIIEAMGFGLPVVSVGGHSRKELIEDGKTGYVIENPFGDTITMEDLEKLNIQTVKNLERKVEDLVLKKDLRNEMSFNCKKIVQDGKFSIDKRNKRLNEIYKGA